MLYTVEIDTAPGVVTGEFDVSAFAQMLEDRGAMDAVVSLGTEGDLGCTAQWDAPSVIDAACHAEEVLLSLLDSAETMVNTLVTAVSAYLTPVLEGAIEAIA